MNRRDGTTLTEVLVAIFIMGIGLMAILSLFPLGAAQMAQALKDQRAAEAAANASSLARVFWKQAVDADKAGPNTSFFRETISGRQYPRSIQRFIYAMDDPNFNDLSGTAPNSQSYPAGSPNIPAGGYEWPTNTLPGPGSGAAYLNQMQPMPLTGPEANKSSYPVFVDMFGWQANQNTGDANRVWWVGGAMQQGPHNKVGMIPRRPLYIPHPNPSAIPPWQVLGTAFPNTPLPAGWNWNTPQRILKQFSLFDDMTFTENGTPDISSGRIERQGRYSWAYMIRRPHNATTGSTSTRHEVDVQVIVYSGRSIDVPTDEKTYLGVPPAPAATLNDSRTVQLVYTNASDKPTLKRGYWLLDATMFDANGAVFPQGRFYRAVNIEDGPAVAGGLTLNVELQTPLAFGPAQQRVFIVMSNVVEVFQIGYVSDQTPPRNILDDQEH